MKQADGQTYCALPWCGQSFGAPYHFRIFLVDGSPIRLRYPSLIDYHDKVPRSRGGDPNDLANQAPLCHECHMAHEDSRPGMRLDFDGDRVTRSDGRSGELVLGDREHLDCDSPHE